MFQNKENSEDQCYFCFSSIDPLKAKMLDEHSCCDKCYEKIKRGNEIRRKEASDKVNK